MAKVKRKRAARPGAAKPLAWGGMRAQAKDRRLNRIIAAVAALLVVAGAVWGWWHFSARWEFDALAAQGAGALDRMEIERDAGRDHLAPGQPFAYPHRFPTSGPHDPAWTQPGVYEVEQPPTRLVHALEHGNIVIYYDRPGEAVMAQLRDWARLYSGQWDGIVVTPARGLGEEVVLTAWTRRLRLDPFDPAAAAAFIDAFRGRGPENPVR
jgi:hypothetical protein